jgi:hypothetical protein
MVDTKKGTGKKVEPPKSLLSDYGIRWHDFVGHWYALYGNVWRKVNETQVKDYLGVKHGISDEREDGLPSLASTIMQNAIENFSVDYAGNFAGYLKVGEYPTTNGKLLITRGRELLAAKKGKHDLVTNFLQAGFCKENQFNAFCGWMLASVLSLQQPIGRWNHGQALLMVGDPGTGKSATQIDIIDPMITNHHADAACFLKGESTFNAQLGEAEHWLMSDPRSSNKKEQDAFLSGMKDGIANVWMFIHPKGKTPIDLPTYRRLTITLNREERALRIVSDLVESEAEKILMLDFEDAGKFAPNGEGGLQYADWKAKIQEQLPAFKYWLLNEFKLPKEMEHPRYGVQYTNPELLKQLAAPTQEEVEANLDGMILDSCFQERTTMINRGIQWVMVDRVELTAGQILDRLTGAQNPARIRAAKLWETQNATRMGNVLSRFHDNGGQRNGYTIKRHTTKKDHSVYILEKTLPASNGQHTTKPTQTLVGMLARQGDE